MSTSESGPTPEETPGLESGGGVAPGDTPPDAGQTSGLSHRQPMPSRTGPIITIVVVVVVTFAIAFLLAARALDLL